MTPAALKAELDHHNLTPVEFARLVGVQFSTVYKWLRGESRVPLMAERLLAAWRVTGAPTPPE